METTAAPILYDAPPHLSNRRLHCYCFSHRSDYAVAEEGIRLGSTLVRSTHTGSSRKREPCRETDWGEP